MDDQPPTGEPPLSLDLSDLTLYRECRESLTELYSFLDGELTSERRTLIRSHIESCRPCLQAFDFEAELRQVVSSCCQEAQLPPGLKERIAQALEEMEQA